MELAHQWRSEGYFTAILIKGFQSRSGNVRLIKAQIGSKCKLDL